jgi:signal transduction histidine kinase
MYQDKITTSAEALLENMEAMLLWSKGQMQQFKPDISKVYIEELFTSLKSTFNNYTQIEFRYINPNNLFLKSDFNFLQTIMQNLMNNAIKARDVNKQSTITWVASSTANGKIQLAITDNGKGLSKQQIATLLSNENVNSQKNGLGFFIVKDLAKAIGLSINISSIEGEETTITLSA